MKKLSILLLGGIFALVFVPTLRARAYQVPSLPDGNLITNPWFRSDENPMASGLDGWTNVLVGGVGWSTSQKSSNPSPDILVNGICGFEQTYCGTSARWAHERQGEATISHPGVDVHLYQVVTTNPAHRRLNFSMYWVNHKIEVAEVLIFGSSSPDGPWLLVWLPITISQDENPPLLEVPGHNGNPWFQTGLLDTTLAAGYPHYKIDLHARYPESPIKQGDVGVKISGVYFATSFSKDSTSLSTPWVIHDPTIEPTMDPSVPPPTPTSTQPSPTPTSTMPPPTPTATQHFKPTATPQEPTPTSQPPTPTPTDTNPRSRP